MYPTVDSPITGNFTTKKRHTVNNQQLKESTDFNFHNQQLKESTVFNFHNQQLKESTVFKSHKKVRQPRRQTSFKKLSLPAENSLLYITKDTKKTENLETVNNSFRVDVSCTPSPRVVDNSSYHKKVKNIPPPRVVGNNSYQKCLNSICNGEKQQKNKETLNALPQREKERGEQRNKEENADLSLNKTNLTPRTYLQNTQRTSDSFTPSMHTLFNQSKSPLNIPRTPSLNVQRTTPLNNPRTLSLNIQRTPPLNIQRTPSLNDPRTPPLNILRTPSLKNQRTPSLNIQRTPSLNDPRTPHLNIPRTPSLNIPRTPSLNFQRTPSLNIPRTPSLNIQRTSPLNNPRSQNSKNQITRDNYQRLARKNIRNHNRTKNQDGAHEQNSNDNKNPAEQKLSDSTSLSYSESISTNQSEESDSDKQSDIDDTESFNFFSSEFYTVLYSNIDQSLTGKREELLGIIEKRKPSIIMLTEIEPKFKKDQTKQIKDSEISIPNYSLFTNNNRKRGVAIFIESKLNPRDCTEEINKKFEECVFCEIEGVNKEKILLGCMYKSPNSNKDNVKNMLETLRNDTIQKYDIICIAGDFNYPKIDWKGYSRMTGENEEFTECIKDAFLIQKVEKPTRNVRLDQQANIVDLVLINEDAAISEIIHCAPLGNSDHDILFFQINVLKQKKKQEQLKKFNLNKGNYTEMRKNMNKENWSKLKKMKVEEAWQNIKDKIIDQMNKHIPKVGLQNTKKLKPCWMNKKVFRRIKKKYHAYKRYLITKQGRDYEIYILDKGINVQRRSKKQRKNMKKT